MSVVKSGYLKRHSKSLFHGGWRDTWVVLYDNSDLCLHKHQHDSDLKARIHLKDVCKRFAYGQYTNGFPGQPDLPEGYTYDSVLAIPSRNNSKCKVFWLLCHDPNELGEWMQAICKTLPPPPNPQQQQQQQQPPPQQAVNAGGGYQGGPGPYPPNPGPYPPGPPPQGYYQQPYQPQYQQQPPYGYAPQQQQHKDKGILGGLGGLFGGKSGGGGGGGGILSGNKGKAAAGLLGGAALGYGATKMIGHGFGGWGLGHHGSWGSMSSFGSSGSFGSIGSFD
uniref:Pleckstrin homology domain-containing family B member 2-like isoform X2 n=1 Tax=Crassostrea virginica TaxID=6565 RepID=A0A8B8E5C9_CRAVI|nr:pleckstrin homology domain-containing family B member 2-like isoform X2 [Crassostrea virginica]